MSVSQNRFGLSTNNGVSHCVDAAKSCINAAELVRELVPPSHHLAFCVYYLILSGLILYALPSDDLTHLKYVDSQSCYRLRLPEYPQEQAKPEVGKCIRFLEGLEMTWSGAKKGRAILESLIKVPDRGMKRSRDEFDEQSDFLNTQIPELDLFGYEALNLDVLNSYLI